MNGNQFPDSNPASNPSGNQSSALRLLFMGTPDFAVASLEALTAAGYPIVAVITAPDKPAGRGMKLTESAVKSFAKKQRLKILQPEKLKDPSFLEEFRALNADLQIVVAFRMLPESVWSMPRLGTINLHGSLLPQYRGAAPLNWAIINGEKETGVTTFRLQHDIDTGNILLQEKMPIGENETAGELHDRMKKTGAALLLKTIEGIANGSIKEKPQQLIPAASLKPAPKIYPQTCIINWNQPVSEVYNLVRGLSPFPGAYTYIDGKQLKIFRSEKDYGGRPDSAGQLDTDNKTFFRFSCTDGWLRAIEIQPEGRKRMLIADFLRGYRPRG